MRISDWSSDVCSSDLAQLLHFVSALRVQPASSRRAWLSAPAAHPALRPGCGERKERGEMTRPDDEMLARMRRAVEALPNLPYEVFRLHRLAELDYPAVADKRGIPVSYVQRNLARAIYPIDRNIKAEGAERN